MVSLNSKQILKFWKKVIKNENFDECWTWKGSICKRHGYGKFRVGNRVMNSHRVIWEHFFGPVPPKMVVRHFKCRNRLCVNVSHMRLGTSRDNWEDSVRDGTARPFVSGYDSRRFVPQKGVKRPEQSAALKVYWARRKALAHPEVKNFDNPSDSLLEGVSDLV